MTEPFWKLQAVREFTFEILIEKAMSLELSVR
jgi:hypothetical protein